MAISIASITRSVSAKPPRILIYGVEGIGKSSFGANAPSPVFLPTEDGLGVIDAPSFPLAQTYDDVLACLSALINEEHGYSTLVVDSLDWMEPLIWRKVAQTAGVGSIEDLGYGKGYVLALDVWRDYLNAINYLRDAKDMMVVQIAHAAIKPFNNPDTDSYDRFEIKLHRNKQGAGASPLLLEHSDCVLFANYKTSVTQEKVGFNNTRTRAVGGGARMLYTQERPSYMAKNRYGLPESLPLDGNAWGVLARHIPYLKRFLPDVPPPGVEEGANIPSTNQAKE